jgi:hypothetical protein
MEQEPKSAFKVNWPFSVGDILAIIGVVITFIWTQAIINARVDVLEVRQDALRIEVSDLRTTMRVDFRDTQTQLREINAKLDALIGATNARLK